MHKLLTVLIAVHFVLSVNGQHSDYLKDLLDKLPEPVVAGENVTPVRAYLPAGFTYFPTSGYVGISDPMMPDTLKAFQQAYLRAVMMYALREGKGKGLTDFYTDDRDGTTASIYQEFILLSSKTEVAVDRFEIQSYQLGSGEFVVVLLPRTVAGPDGNTLEFTTRIELYSKEVVSGGVVQTYSKMNLQQQLRDSVRGIQNKESVEYQFTNTNRVALRSVFNGEAVEQGDYRYFYQSTDEVATEPADSVQGALTFHGLWFAAVADLFSQVTSQFQTLSTKVSRVGDQYDAMALVLNRETGEFTYRLKINRWDFRDNKLRLRDNVVPR